MPLQDLSHLLKPPFDEKWSARAARTAPHLLIALLRMALETNMQRLPARLASEAKNPPLSMVSPEPRTYILQKLVHGNEWRVRLDRHEQAWCYVPDNCLDLTIVQEFGTQIEPEWMFEEAREDEWPATTAAEFEGRPNSETPPPENPQAKPACRLFYCPEHEYNPPEGSGFAFCPKCEAPSTPKGLLDGLYSVEGTSQP